MSAAARAGLYRRMSRFNDGLPAVLAGYGFGLFADPLVPRLPARCRLVVEIQVFLQRAFVVGFPLPRADAFFAMPRAPVGAFAVGRERAKRFMLPAAPALLKLCVSKGMMVG